MADVVWSVLVGLPDARPEQVDRMVEMARLWAAHLRGPGEHEGPVVLLTNLDDLSIEGVSAVAVQSRARERRELLRECPALALRHLEPSEVDRCLQCDIDSLARHPIEPLFAGIVAGGMRVAPSMLPLTHWQQLGLVLGRWRLAWCRHVRGWHRRLGVSSSHSGCAGADWADFMGRWAAAVERHPPRSDGARSPGDQAYLNWLYAVEGVPMRRYGPDELHHLRLDDPAPRERIEAARILHFPLPDKLERMREWSRL